MGQARLWLGGTALLPVLLGALLAQIAGVPRVAPAATSAIVLVSGRDDHGLLANPQVTLYDAPNSVTPLARVRDGSYARVLATRGTWQQIETLIPPQQRGWLDDYYLRGLAIRLDGGGQVTFAAARLNGDQVEIAVRPVEAAATAPFWVPAARLREVGAK